MAINSFETTFGSKLAKGKKTNDEDLVKAEFWINIGYTIEVDTDEGKQDRFISLPMGLPLDTMKELPTTSQNDTFRGIQAARNDLRAQLLAAVADMVPGEERIISECNGLQIQLRRVKEEKAAPTASANPFAKKLSFAA